jgi:DNA gyrase subunit B
LQYVDDITSRILPFANNIYNSEGGTHITGFKTALTRTLNNYGRKNNLIKESEDNFTGEDVLEGLTAVISVKIREIQFEGQTKASLVRLKREAWLNRFSAKHLMHFLKKILTMPEQYSESYPCSSARKAAKAAKDSVLAKRRA